MEPDLKDNRTVLGPAAFIAIQETSEGVLLYRFDENGRTVGDTWHPTVKEAEEQASYEYGDALKEWIAMSPDVKDVIEFGLGMIRTAE